MPKTSAGKAILGTVALVAGAFTGNTYLITFGVNMLLAGAAQELADEPRQPDEPKSSVKLNFQGEESPLYLVFGQHRVGGHISVLGVSGDNNKYLHMGVTHSVASPAGMSDITDIWLDERKIDDTIIDGSGDITSGDYQGIVNIRRYLGTDSETADTVFTGPIDYQNSNSFGRGLARIHVRLEKVADDEKFRNAFPRGVPQLTALLEGRCYDPRLDSTNGGSGSQTYSNPDTWTFSQNPALCAATYLIMAASDGGWGVSPSRIDWTSVAASANRCDDLVERPDNAGGTVFAARHTCNIILDTGEGIRTNLGKILTSMDGTVYTGLDGQIRIVAGEYDVPTTTIDDTWIRQGEISAQLDTDDDKVHNAVRARYIEPLVGWQPVSCVPYTNSTYEAEDGRREYIDLDIPATTDRYEAQYLCAIAGRKSRHQRSLTLPLNYKGFDVELRENVTVSLTDPAVSGVFKVVNWKYDLKGPIVTLLEQTSTAWDSAIGDYTETVPTVPASLVNQVPPTPTGLTAGSVINGVALSWDPLGAGEYAQILVYRATSSAGTYTNIADVRGNTYTDPRTDGETYYYKIKATSPLRNGTSSDFSSIVSSNARLLHTNLIRNPSGALGTRFWSDFGGATVGSLLAPDGWQLRFAGASSGTRGIFTDIDAMPNVAYSLSGEVYAAGLNSGTVVFDVVWLDSGGSQIGDTGGVGITSAAGWAYYKSENFVSPAGTAKARVRIFQQDANSAGVVIAGRNLKLEEGEYATLFSDEATQEGNRLTVADSGVQVGDQRNSLAIISANFTNGLVSVSGSNGLLAAFDQGTSVRIQLNACTLQFGFGPVSYNQSSKTGHDYNSQYFVYASDPGLDGGTVTLLTDPVDYSAQSDSDYVFFGGIVTAGPGEESHGTGEILCVHADAWMDGNLQARGVDKGARILCWDGDMFFGEVEAVEPVAEVPCVRLETETGATLTCSVATPIDQPDGRSVLAAHMHGGQLLTEQADGSFQWEAVKNPRLVGIQPVAKISVGGISFAASDEKGGRRIVTHNGLKA